MQALKSIRVRLPGRWIDAWLYKESLVLWSPGGDLYYVPLSTLRSVLEARSDAHIAAVVDHLILRTDWKKAGHFRGLMGVAEIESSFLSVFGEGDSITIKLPNVEPDRVMSGPHSGYVVDTFVYGNRVYSATEVGLFETEFNPAYPHAANPTIRVFEQPVQAVTANYGEVAFACGDAGLLTRTVNFTDGADWWRSEDVPQRVDDYSIDTSFALANLLNYTGDVAPSLITSTTESDTSATWLNFKQRRIRSFDRPRGLADSVRRAVDTPGRVEITLDAGEIEADQSDVQVLGNSNHHMLVLQSTRYSVVNIVTPSGREPSLNRDKRFRISNMRLDLVADSLSTEPLESGFLLEGFDKTGLVTHQGTYEVISEPRVRVRTFPRSRRHSDCFIAIGEDFIELVGFYEISRS